MASMKSGATGPMTPSTMATPGTGAKVMTPTQEQIAKRAYEKWVKRGRPQGTHMQDWLEAENELKREITSGTTNNPNMGMPAMNQSMPQGMGMPTMTPNRGR